MFLQFPIARRFRQVLYPLQKAGYELKVFKFLALKGRYISAQGNALGKDYPTFLSPERAK
jgi:hypothetical protein